MEYKSIAVRPETLERFKGFGKYGDNADDVLNNIMDIAEKTLEFTGVKLPEKEEVKSS